MVVRVEYNRSNGVRLRRTGNRPSHAVAQGAIFLQGAGPPDPPPPLAPALVVTLTLATNERVV